MQEILEQVKDYYGKQLQSSDDLQTGACCCGAEALPLEVRDTLPLIAGEILERFYGCGSPIPPLLDGLTVLDLGCGTGRDVYLASRLVGEQGQVIGVDMTSEQLALARKYQEAQAQAFGFAQSNVTLNQGYIEDLAALGIADESIDLVISNCVINLSPAKEQVFNEIYRVLKPGGELFFADVFANSRVPEELASDPVLRGECLGGAMYIEDFRRLMARVGWLDFRYTSLLALAVDNPEIAQRLEGISFTSRTVRAIKSDLLEDRCEQYGQVAVYKGTIPNHPASFALDTSHNFMVNTPLAVCGNTAAMIQDSRYGQAFDVLGNRSVHYGLFQGCGSGDDEDCCADSSNAKASNSGACC